MENDKVIVPPEQLASKSNWLVEAFKRDPAKFIAYAGAGMILTLFFLKALKVI